MNKLIRSSVAALALCAGHATLAQSPSDQPVASSEEALAKDAQIYARLYGVSQTEAAERIKIMVASQQTLESLDEAEGEDLVAGYFDHGDQFAYVIETNASNRGPRNIEFSGGDIPTLQVKYKQNGKVGRGKIRKLFRERNNIVDRLFPEALMISFDERKSVLQITIDETSDSERAERDARQIQNAVGVEVQLIRSPNQDTRVGMKGGYQPWRNSGTATSPTWITQCSLGFAAKAPDGKEGYITAGHCGSSLAWKEPGSTTYQNLTVRNFSTSTGDWQFVYGAPVERLFKADNNAALRTVSGRRTMATTCEKTGVSVDPNKRDAIVVVADGSGSYCSGATNGTFVCWYGGHYGAPFAANHGTHREAHPGAGQQCGEINAKYVKLSGCGVERNLACDYAWVEVIPKEGQSSFVAGVGDSGSPIFAWNTAFGIVTHSSARQDMAMTPDYATGTSRVIWYTPIDEIYRNGYSLLY